MRIAITGGAGRLGQALATRWQATHQVRTVDAVPLPPGSSHQDHLAGDLRDPAFAQQAVTDATVLVHLAPIAPAGPAATSDLDRLDVATRGTYQLLLAAADAGVQTVVLGSTLDLFAAYPGAWHVTEQWAPKPAPTPAHLAPYLAECSARELARVLPLQVVCLRLGEVVDETEVEGQPFDGRWLHLDDALQAFEQAIAFEPPEAARNGWWVYHIPAAGSRTRVPLVAASEALLEYAPLHDFQAWWPAEYTHQPAAPALPAVESRAIRKVVVFGAGGPLAAATAPLLAETYTLRLTDLRPLADIVAEGKPRTAWSPLPTLPDPPHETREVDITDYGQVLAACEGMDAIVNCTVNRTNPVEAFRVNCLGAYNVMQAAVAQGIRRVVHTGPQMVTSSQGAGYSWDYDVGPDVPPRPGSWLYAHTKYLGHEAIRVFAEAYRLEVPTLYFTGFVHSVKPRRRPDRVGAFTVLWEDAGVAIRRALEVPSLPRPFEVFFISADLPHGKYSNEKAKRLLGWQPRDSLAHLWGQRD
ncbi:MAG: hypothetical protein CL878_03965 [Dehalococcoidia bacterium]|nr:hypothetical protein [Dehalococcoidia bacterium]